MLKLNDAPQRGTTYATFIDKMVYKKYESLKEIEELVVKDKLLEIHLFDKEKELRFLKTRDEGIVQYLISDTKEYAIYEEELYVSGENIDKQDKLSEKIKVVNYIKYDENDMIHIINYRLAEVEQCQKK